jgi:hypothetical protein
MKRVTAHLKLGPLPGPTTVSSVPEDGSLLARIREESVLSRAGALDFTLTNAKTERLTLRGALFASPWATGDVHEALAHAMSRWGIDGEIIPDRLVADEMVIAAVAEHIARAADDHALRTISTMPWESRAQETFLPGDADEMARGFRATAWLIHPLTFMGMRNRRDSSGEPVFPSLRAPLGPSFWDPYDPMLCNRPVLRTTRVPRRGLAILGDFSRVVIGRSSEVDLSFVDDPHLPRIEVELTQYVQLPRDAFRIAEWRTSLDREAALTSA